LARRCAFVPEPFTHSSVKTALESGDRAALLALHEGLSERSAYFRYFSLSRQAGEAHVDHLLATDTDDLSSLIALIGDDVVGLASYERLPAADEAEAALLVENGLADAFRPLVVVSAPLNAQIARARGRDGASESEVRARVTAQRPLEEKVKAADVVIQNDSSLEVLHARADEALDEVRRLVGLR